MSYPDSAAGAAACLRELSIFKTLKDVKCRPDSSVTGVWEVRHIHKGVAFRHVVYLAGYPDPWGRIRQFDEFETEEGE